MTWVGNGVWGGGGGLSLVDRQLFVTSGVWTKPVGARWVEVFCVGGGGGGGSGRRGAAGSARSGGAGGAGGSMSWADPPTPNMRAFVAVLLPATVEVSVGAGGAGGPAVTVNNVSGTAGGPGGTSTFGGFATAPGGAGGAGGATALAAAGQPGLGARPGTAGANSSVTVVTVPVVGQYMWQCLGGGNGGAITTGNVPIAGSNGNILKIVLPSSQAPGGAAVTAGNGSPGVSCGTWFGPPYPGLGGGGGGASLTLPGGAGGAGGLYGGGGGGGAASLNGYDSGAGADGGTGCVLVITHFR